MTQRLFGPRPLRVALYSAIYIQNDAISNSLHNKVEILSSLRDAGAPVSWTVFTLATDYEDDSVRLVGSVGGLLSQPRFWEADLHIFEFGIHYDLFNAVYLLTPGKVAIAVYHNVTPRHLVTQAETLAAIEKSESQQMNLFAMAHVACDSEFNRQCLLELGLDPERLSLLHLPPAAFSPPSGRVPPHERNGPVRLLYVGRMVSSKGVLELVDAVQAVVESGHDVHLSLAGNTRLSDPEIVSELYERAGGKLAGHLDVLGHVEADELEQLYATSDVLVMPSHHEGYCVTVVEAFASGCFVVAYDAGNLPNVVGEVGLVVPTGNVPALVDSLALVAERIRTSRDSASQVVFPTVGGDMNYDAWCEAVTLHNRRFDRQQYDERFTNLLRLVADDLERAPRSDPELAGLRIGS